MGFRRGAFAGFFTCLTHGEYMYGNFSGYCQRRGKWEEFYLSVGTSFHLTMSCFTKTLMYYPSFLLPLCGNILSPGNVPHSSVCYSCQQSETCLRLPPSWPCDLPVGTPTTATCASKPGCQIFCFLFLSLIPFTGPVVHGSFMEYCVFPGPSV